MNQMQTILSLFTACTVFLSGCSLPTQFPTGTGEKTAAVGQGLEDIPDYSGEPYVVLGDNTPDVPKEDFTTNSFETYGALDNLGRCTTA